MMLIIFSHVHLHPREPQIAIFPQIKLSRETLSLHTKSHFFSVGLKDIAQKNVSTVFLLPQKQHSEIITCLRMCKHSFTS